MAEVRTIEVAWPTMVTLTELVGGMFSRLGLAQVTHAAQGGPIDASPLCFHRAASARGAVARA